MVNFRLFERIDIDNDKFVTQSELKRLIMEINSEKIPEDVDEATAKIMQDLDTSGDQQIDEQEFIDGFKDWLNTSNYQIVPKSPGTKSTDVSEVTHKLLFCESILVKFVKSYV